MPRFSCRPPLLGTAFAVAVLTLLVVAGASPSPAGAAVDVKYGLTDDAWLQHGPGGTLDERLAQLDALGVRIVRFSLDWNEIARSAPSSPSNPEDPAYDWSQVTPVIDGLKAHGIDVLLQLVGTPSWANGGKGTNYAPTSSGAFAGFAAAAAREFPWVHRWMIWNEPNQRRWLRPTSASLYVIRLLNPAYTAIHDVIPGAQVAGGGTAPRASTGGVSPVAWLEGMHTAHARLDAYAHNPYPLDPKRETPASGGCTHCDTITMATLNRLVSLVAKDFPRARIWLTEYGYQTNPPDRILGVGPSLQARYLSEAAYIAYRTPRVDMLIQFLYRDEPTLSRFQSGLVTLGNAKKPAFSAFELPLAETARTGPRTSLWGQLRAPADGGTATLERRVGSAWKRFATVKGGTSGFFRFTGTLERGSVVRLHAGTLLGAPLTIT
jgi:Cellulase (glycosyl hydrolase family 5)